MSSSESSGSSVSSSTSKPIETPENSIIDQISGVASGLAQQMLQWANGVFAQTSAITNQAVGNFFDVSQKMVGLSNNMTGQYNNLFAPENAQLVADANSYNSSARQKVDMGMAGATQAQAGDAALKNAEASLQSYGINPSDGRYAALDKAAAVQNSANVAGAENMQRVADTTTGQNLRQSAVNVGAQLPAAIANINNTAIQANTGASNASLANANTGANLMKLPNDYLTTAMNVKLPPMGTQSSGSSQNQSHSNGPSPSGGGGGNPGSGSGGSGSGGPAWMPNHNPMAGGTSTGGSGAVGRGLPSAMVGSPPAYGMGDPFDGQGFNPMGDTTANDFTGGSGSMGIGQPGSSDANIFNNDQGTGYGDQGSNMFGQDLGAGGFGQTLPQDNSGFGGLDNTFGNMGGGTDTQYGNISYNPDTNPAQGDTSGFGDYSQPAPTDWGSGADQYSSYDSGGGDYAQGGAIDTGSAGSIPQQMSPSQGQQTDDIPAQGPGGAQLHMNANEFVIPQDVALWKGQEFFQNLISQSRKKRMTAPAHPTQHPGAAQAPQPQAMG